MSNPGVIKLASISRVGATIKRFDIEDNIGEAIHIHINQLRIDLSIVDFLAFAKQLMECFDRMKLLGGYSYALLDPFFLFRMRWLISSIESIDIAEVSLSQLRALHRVNIPKVGDAVVPVPLTKTSVYAYLSGTSSDFLNYKQDGYPTVDNALRLTALSESFRLHGYPYNGQCMVLFGDQNYIRDGQHRASILAYYLGVDAKVPVMRFLFTSKSYRLIPYWDLFKSLSSQLLKRGYYFGGSLLKRLYRRLL